MIPVSPAPFPTNEPEKVEPEIADVFVKSTVTDEPDTINDPVISASPFLVPSHHWPGSIVQLEPSPEKDTAVTTWLTYKEPLIVTEG